MLIRISALTIAVSALMCAHEIGTTRVTAVFENGRTYDIEVVTDAVSLADKIEAYTGSVPRPHSGAARIETLLTQSGDAFRRRVKVTFDGGEVRPEITYAVTPGSGTGAAAVATIHLRGQIPAGVHRFAWNYGWTFASYALTLRNEQSDKAGTEWLEGGQSSTPFPLAAPVAQISRLQIAWRYLTLGFTHILPKGLDHMLFVLGIYLLSRRRKSIFMQVSAFTVAHSITLGLSMYGILSVPPRIVEPMIALSIAYIAVENIFVTELKSWRVALVFGFGLLHGMGFAGALKELGLPRSEFVTALLTFNAGVEAGQLAVIAAAFLLVGWHYSQRVWYRSRIVVPASMMIACMAVYWTVERLSL